MKGFVLVGGAVACGCLIALAPLTEKFVFPSLNCLHTFVRKQLGLFLGSLLSPLVCVTVPHQCHPVLTTVTAALIFLFRNCLAVLGLFSSHVSCRTSFLCHRRPC